MDNVTGITVRSNSKRCASIRRRIFSVAIAPLTGPKRYNRAKMDAYFTSVRAMENSHTTRRVIVKSEEGRMQITGRVGIHRVADVGPVQGDDGDAVDAFGGDARVHAAITHEPVATGYGEQP